MSAPIVRVPVISSNVTSIGLDHENGVLEVEFKNGGVYRYWPIIGARADAYAGILAGATSAGKYVTELKRDPLIECVKVEVAA